MNIDLGVCVCVTILTTKRIQLYQPVTEGQLCSHGQNQFSLSRYTKSKPLSSEDYKSQQHAPLQDEVRHRRPPYKRQVPGFGPEVVLLDLAPFLHVRTRRRSRRHPRRLRALRVSTVSP